MGRFISTILVGAVGWLVASLAVAQEAGTLRLETAAWVPKRDASYGWWGAARAGDGPKRMVQTTKDADTLRLPPGSYDVWWVQEYDTSDRPVALARGVEVKTNATASVKASSGLKLTTAPWVPPRDPSYGWWGAVRAGEPPKNLVNWSKKLDAILLPPGDYDVYYVQEYDSSDRPVPLMRNVKVAGDEPVAVRAASGLALDVAAWVPARDASYGWWGAVRAGDPPKNLVNWTKKLGSIVLPAGDYDVYYVQEYDSSDRPVPLARNVKVAGDEPVRVRAASGMKLDVASWVPPRDASYGWWGAVRAGESSKQLVNWTKKLETIVLPPGDYDVYWVQDYDNSDRPMALARAVRVEPDRQVAIAAASGVRLKRLEPLAGNAWWGLAPAGGKPDATLQRAKKADAAMLVPPGSYDLVGGGDAAPTRRRENIAVAAGELVEVDLPGNAETVAATTPQAAPPVAPGAARTEPPAQTAAAAGVTATRAARSVITSFAVSTSESATSGTDFPAGTKRIDARYRWERANGEKIKIIWSLGGETVLEQEETLAQPSGSSTWYLAMSGGSPLAPGEYSVQLAENDVKLPPLPFRVLAGSAAAAPAAPGPLEVKADGFPPPALASYRSTQRGPSRQLPNTQVEQLVAQNGDGALRFTTNDVVWAWASAPSGDLSKGFLFRDPSCSGRFTEKWANNVAFTVPDCAAATK